MHISEIDTCDEEGNWSELLGRLNLMAIERRNRVTQTEPMETNYANEKEIPPVSYTIYCNKQY